MNKVILLGRMTRDPDVRYTTGENPMAMARFTIAADRKFAKRDDPNAQTADFIPCIAFGKQAEVIEKYTRQGSKIAVVGRMQSGSYVNKDGQRIYTLDVAVEEFEFAESKGAGSGSGNATKPETPTATASVTDTSTFVNIPDAIDEDEVPFG